MLVKFQAKLDQGEGPDSIPMFPGMAQPQKFDLEKDREHIMKKIAYER